MLKNLAFSAVAVCLSRLECEDERDALLPLYTHSHTHSTDTQDCVYEDDVMFVVFLFASLSGGKRERSWQ